MQSFNLLVYLILIRALYKRKLKPTLFSIPSHHSDSQFSFFTLIVTKQLEAEMEARGVCVAVSILVFCLVLVEPCYGSVLFSSLKKTLDVTASPKQDQVLLAGEDKITVTWVVNNSLPAGTDSAYKTIKVKLCYAPVSQKDRAWRKTEDNLKKDKTCQHKIVSRPYDASNKTVQSFEWRVEKDVPTATYFVRAFAYDSNDVEVGYGQTTNLFGVQAISGRHASLDITAACFSAFSVISLFVFFYIEKRKGKASQQK